MNQPLLHWRRPPTTQLPLRGAATRLPVFRGARHRVALVTEYYYPHQGGVCEHVHFLAAELRRRGHHVDIITSALGDAPNEPRFRDVLRNDHEALMVPCGDPSGLAAALARVLDDPALRRRLSTECRSCVSRYGWPAVTDDVVAVYGEVTTRSLMDSVVGHEPLATRAVRVAVRS